MVTETEEEAASNGLLFAQFEQLVAATVRDDGCGAEPAHETHARFERLHAALQEGAG